MITVKGRELIIPKSEQQIGTPYDNNSEVRHIRIDRVTSGGIDIANLSYRLDLKYANAVLDTCLLDIEVQDDYILLTWTIPDTCLTQKGTVWIAIRAYDENGSIKWATNRGAVYVGHTIYDGEGYTGKLSELEQLEERIRQRSETLDASEGERQEAENQREANEERRKNNEAEWQRQANEAIDIAEETLYEAKEQAATAAQEAATATEKAAEASASATVAAGSAETATQEATTATEKAAVASASATAAAGSAETATQEATTATEKAAEASASATAAAKSAETAAQEAATATEKAAEASASATVAAGSAETATQEAATATEKAAEASASATAAAKSAESAELAAGCDGTAMSISANDNNGLGSTNVQAQLDILAAPIFEDSGEVEEISKFQDFQNSVTSGMRILDFFKNLKAGLKFILHTGQLVNHGLCNEPGKYPLDAAYGKNLLDMIGNVADLPGGADNVVNALVTQNSNLGLKTSGTPLSGNTPAEIIAAAETYSVYSYAKHWDSGGPSGNGGDYVIDVTKSYNDYYAWAALTDVITGRQYCGTKASGWISIIDYYDYKNAISITSSDPIEADRNGLLIGVCHYNASATVSITIDNFQVALLANSAGAPTRQRISASVCKGQIYRIATSNSTDTIIGYFVPCM